jgi:hypothetical protein
MYNKFLDGRLMRASRYSNPEQYKEHHLPTKNIVHPGHKGGSYLPKLLSSSDYRIHRPVRHASIFEAYTMIIRSSPVLPLLC